RFKNRCVVRNCSYRSYAPRAGGANVRTHHGERTTMNAPRASARNRRLDASDSVICRPQGLGAARSLIHPPRTLADPQAVVHQPLPRRRPLSSTGTGAVYNELHGVGRYLAAAGPCDAVVDIKMMSKTVKWRLPTSSSGASSFSRPSSPPPSLF